MSQKVSNSNILTGEPLISSTPPLILLQSEEDLTSDLSPNQTCENPCGDSVSEATSLTSKAEDSGISSSTARSCDRAPSADSCKAANSGTASSSIHDESWNIESLLTEDKNPFSTLTEEHLSRLEDVLSSEEVRSFLQQTQLQELNSGLGDSDSPVRVASRSGARLEASATSEPLELDVFQNQAPASCSLQIDDALANQDGVREQELAAMAAAFMDHAYALPYVDAFTDTTASSPRKSARIKQRADDGKSAYDSDFEYYLTSNRRRKKEETFEEEGTPTESSQISATRSPSTAASQPKRRSTRIVDMENREKAEKILQENRLKEQEAKEAMMKSTEKDSETPDEGKGETKVESKPKKKRGRPPKVKAKCEPEVEDEEDRCDAADLETKKVIKQDVPDKPIVKGRRGRRPASTGLPALSPALPPATGVDADMGGEGTKEQKPAVGKPGRKKKLLPQVKEVEPEQVSQPAENKTTQDCAHIADKGDCTEKPMNTEPALSDSRPTACGDATLKDEEVEGTVVSKNKLSSLSKGPIKPASHWKKGGMKIKAVGGKALPASEKRGAKAQPEALKMEESSEEDDLPLKAFAKSPKKEPQTRGKQDGEAQPGEKWGGKAGPMGGKKKKMEKQQKDAVAGHRRVSEGVKSALSENKKKASSKPVGAAEASRPSLAGKKLKISESHDKKATLTVEVKKDGDHKTPEKADGKPRTIKIGEKGEDSHGMKQLKHKHRKSDEIIIDPTVTDLFKPDGIIPTDPVKKEETDTADGKGQHHGGGLLKVEPTGDGNMQAAQVDRPADVTESISSQTKEEKQGHAVRGNNHSSEISADKNRTGSDRKLSASSVEPSEKAADVDIKPFPELVKAVHSGSQDAASECSKKNSESAKTILTSPSGERNAESVKSVSKTTFSEKSSESAKSVPRSASSEGNSESAKSVPKPASSERNSISSKSVAKSASSERISENSKSMSKSTFSVSEKNSESSKNVSKSTTKIVKEHSSDLKSQDHKKSEKSAELKHPPGRSSVEDAGHESGDLSYEDDENDSDWEPAHDPLTLYCICRKPHGNKFMICCDKCQEWYHGHCVGVSRAQGHRMEQENKEYICPVCTGTVVGDSKGTVDTEKKGAAPPLPTPGQEGSKKSKHDKEEKKLEKRPSFSSKDISSKSPKEKKEKWKPQRCVASDCRRDARLGSVYCSTACIVRHAQDSLRLLHKNTQQELGPKEKDTSRRNSSEDSPVKVLERRSGRVLSGSQAPTEAQLEIWLETHPTFEVLQPSSFYKKKDKARKHKSSHGQTLVKKMEEKKETDSETSKSSKQDDGPDLVRLSVRKTLRDALVTRAEEADDIMLSASEIKHLAVAIEEELFKVYSSTGHKYRAKYRTLLFNLKDQKNKGLYRKVLTGKIKPSHLVKMTTEELASRELAKWREMEVKHTLERIEQTEKEAMKEGQHHIRKKTHKGEVEVEDEDMSTLVSRVEEQKAKPESKEEETTQSTVVDTTDQHRAHLFDLNCKICTGKVLPPVVEEPPTKKVTHTVNEEEEEDKAEPAKVDREEEREPQQEAAAITSRRSHSSDGEVSAPVATHRPPSLSHVTVGSPDSALQSGLESKPKFTPSGPMLWKGFISMQDFAKFFTSAYKVSGPVENLALPDTVQICGRISPDQMWDYLGKIRQAGSRDICILRFIPGSDDEKVAYVHLYSYLNSRGRCGVVGNVPKDIKDLYLVPLASHSKIPQVLLPFDGPGLESNRPHMLVGIVVRQKAKRPSEWQPPSKAPVNTGSHNSPSQSKKMRLSAKDTEAYSPTAEGEDASGHEPQYIPTPTVVIQRSNASATSSSSSTPSSSDRISSATTPSATVMGLPHRRSSKAHVSGSGKERKHGLATKNGAEPYSPSSVVAADAPYDPEDESQFVEVEVSSSMDDGAVPAASSTGPPAPSAEGSGKVKVTSGEQCGASTTKQPSSSSVNVDSIVQKISTSTSPQEISSLMVTALASAKNSTEQQQLLALLANRVQQQKKINAENKLKDKQGQPGDVKDLPASETSGSVQDSDSQPILSSSSTNVQSSAAVTAPPSTSCGAAATPTSNISSRVSLVGQQSSSPAQPISRISSLTPDTENMPLALKALMEDLKGNMQMSKAVDKRTERDRRDFEKKEFTHLTKDTPSKGGEAVSSAAEQTASKANVDDTETKSEVLEPVIPGLGGVEDEGKRRTNMAADEVVGSNSIFEVVASSRLAETEAIVRTGPADGGDQLTALGLDVSAALALADVDLRQMTLPGLDSKFSGSAEQATKSDEAILSLQDQDDRFPAKAVYTGLPSGASGAAPILHPALPPTFAGHHRVPSSSAPSLQTLHSQHSMDVHDVDHRRHLHTAGPFAGVAVGPPLFSSRASSQPPPPGTEMEDAAMPGCFAVSTIGDVDMRQQPSKRSAAPLTAGDQSAEKVPRHDAVVQQPPPLPPLPPQPPPPPPPPPSALAATAPDAEAGRILPDFGDRSGGVAFRPDPSRHGTADHPGGVVHREEGEGEGGSHDYHPRGRQHSGQHHPRYSPMQSQHQYRSSPHHRYGHNATAGNRQSKNGHLNRGRP